MLQKTEQEIMKSWRGNLDEPVVSICSIVYNQGRYVAETIEGFLAQETDFPFEILIHDDASTDDSAEIIREYAKKYPNIIKPILQTENQYSQGINPNHAYNYPRAKGKYIALCEGDDYWIDPLKLRKQVDFLEKNPDYGLVHTDKIYYYQKDDAFTDSKTLPANQLTYYSDEVARDYKYEEIINWGCNILTLTTCFRKELLKGLPELDSSAYFRGDRLLYLHIALQSKIKYLKDKTAVYRVLENTTSRFTDPVKSLEFLYKHANLVLYFLGRHPVNPLLHQHVFYRNMFMKFQYALATGNYDIYKTVQLHLPPNPSVKMIGAKGLYVLCKNRPFFSILSRFYKKRIYAPCLGNTSGKNED